MTQLTDAHKKAQVRVPRRDTVKHRRFSTRPGQDPQVGSHALRAPVTRAGRGDASAARAGGRMGARPTWCAHMGVCLALLYLPSPAAALLRLAASLRSLCCVPLPLSTCHNVGARGVCLPCADEYALHRFLNPKHYDVSLAKDAWKAWLHWRKEWAVDTLLETEVG